MASRSDQKDALRPLITMWMDIAAATLLSLNAKPDRRIWIVIDELPSLNRLPSLQALQAEGRKYGACAVLGFQSFSQLCDIYGRHGAETMTGLCSSWVIYRANEPATAEWCAKSIGSVENIEPNEALSYGANTMRDGVNLSQPIQVRSLVMPSEIQSLPNRHGYIRLPGDLPIAQFEIPYRARPSVAQEFIPINLAKTCHEVCA
jgi:type IV secretory pathway TraG/TraD family ATPase VirD4